MINNVFTNGRKAFEVGATPTDVPTMPIEFSVAAFRFGHSMIRADYNWNARFPDGQGTLDFLFSSRGRAATWRRHAAAEQLDRGLAAHVRLHRGRPQRPQGARNKINRARRIDTMLVNPLKNLPPGSFGGPAVDFDDPRANLAFRNIARAKMVKLATGQKMATFLKSQRRDPEGADQGADPERRGGADLAALTAAQRTRCSSGTPLWFYVLREAELNSGKLKGVGGRILAETFHRAMEGSEYSIVRDPAWRPTLGPNNTTFRMVDLLLFAFEGKKDLLAPLGN